MLHAAIAGENKVQRACVKGVPAFFLKSDVLDDGAFARNERRLHVVPISSARSIDILFDDRDSAVRSSNDDIAECRKCASVRTGGQKQNSNGCWQFASSRDFDVGTVRKKCGVEREKWTGVSVGQSLDVRLQCRIVLTQRFGNGLDADSVRQVCDLRKFTTELAIYKHKPRSFNRGERRVLDGCISAVKVRCGDNERQRFQRSDRRKPPVLVVCGWKSCLRKSSEGVPAQSGKPDGNMSCRRDKLSESYDGILNFLHGRHGQAVCSCGLMSQS